MRKINLLLENFNNEQNYVWVFSWEVISCKVFFPEVWQYWWQLLFSGEFPINHLPMSCRSRVQRGREVGGPAWEVQDLEESSLK